MKDCLTVTARFFAVMFAICFVILTTIILVSVTLELTLFNPETYKRALIEENVYQRLPSLFADQLIYTFENRACLDDPSQCFEEGEEPSSGERNPPAYFQNLSTDDWKHIFSVLITPAWVQEQTESLIDQISNFLDTDQPELTLTVSLEDFKTRLAGEEGMQLFEYIVQAQPPCTLEHLVTIAGMILSGDLNDIPACAPPPEVVSQLSPLIHSLLGEVVATMPDQVEITHLQQNELAYPDSQYTLFDFRTSLKWARFATRLSLFIPFMLLFLILVLGVRSLKGWLLWWGIPLCITGLLLFGLVAGSAIVVNLWVAAFFSSQIMNNAGISSELARLPVEIGMDVLKPATIWLMIEAVLLLMLGFVMVVVSFFVPPTPQVQNNQPGNYSSPGDRAY